MIVACASYSANVKTVQNLSFMVVKTTISVSEPISYKSVQCSYIALQGLCTASCGSDQMVKNGKAIDTPSDDNSRKCETAGVNVAGVQTSSLMLYKNYCKAFPTNTQSTCDLASKCQDGGNTTMAFAVIGCITALLSIVSFAWRMNADGICPKVTAFMLSGVTFIACTTAFGAFQSCAKGFYDEYEKYAKNNSNVKNNYYPGIGGDMAVASFVFFIYVWLMSVFVPSHEPAANSGLDNKAPQV